MFEVDGVTSASMHGWRVGVDEGMDLGGVGGGFSKEPFRSLVIVGISDQMGHLVVVARRLSRR